LKLLDSNRDHLLLLLVIDLVIGLERRECYREQPATTFLMIMRKSGSVEKRRDRKT
jgi:hypothetical protein